MKNKFLRLVLFTAVIGLSFIILLAGISMTQPSSSWFVNWIIKTNDIPLKIENIEGRLIDSIYLYGLNYKDKEGNELTLDKLVFDWSPSNLLSYKAQIDRIELEGLTYSYSGDSSNKSLELPELSLPSLPFDINVNELNIQNAYVLIGDTEQTIQQVKSSLTFDDNGLSFQLKELDSEQQHLNGFIILSKNTQTDIDAVINWVGELQNKPAKSQLEIKGPQNNVSISLELDSIIEATLDGNLNLAEYPYESSINCDIKGKLFEDYSEHFIIDKPINLSLSGNLNDVVVTLDTHAKLASGGAFTINIEKNVALPGEKYDAFNINVNWEFFPDVAENIFLSLKGQGDFEYHNQILNIDHELQSPFAVNLKGSLNFPKELIDLSMQWNEVDIPYSDSEKLYLHTGEVSAKGKMDALLVSLATEYAISNENSGDNKTYDSIYAEGEINLLGEQPAGEIKGTLKPSVPAKAKGYINSISAVDFVLRSENDSIMILANAGSESEQLGPINLSLIAQLKNSIVNVELLALNMLEGELKASGTVDFQDKINGVINLKGQHLNIGVINPDLVSKLDLNAGVIISETEQGLATEIDLSSLSGKWRGFPLTSSAQLAHINDTYRIEKLNINSGNNTAAVNLNIEKSLSGDIDLSIEDLSLFSSELAGAIKGRIELSGNINAPKVEGKLNGKDIVFNDIRLASFTADSSIDLEPQQHSTIKLQLASLHYKDYMFDEVIINGQGLTESHQFDISSSGSKLNIYALVNSGLNNKIWSGELMQIELIHKDVGTWQSPNSSAYSWLLQENKFELQKTCLSQNKGHFCITAKGTDTDMNSDIELEHLPLKIIEPIIPETILLKGEVSGDVKFNFIDDSWNLISNIESGNTELGSGYDNEPEYIDIEVASLKLKANENERELDVKLNSNNYFDLSFSGFMQNKDESALKGKLDLVFEDIAWLENIEPALNGSYGKFQASISAGGTFIRPVIEGNFSLQDGLLNVLPIGLNLDQIEGRVQTKDAINQIQVSSIFGSNDKELLMDGFISLIAEENYPYEFKIIGESFPMVRTADITMDVSPDLTLSGTKELNYIRGQLTVPLLDILISSIPESAVSISPDVVIIQSKQADTIHVTNGAGGNDFVKNHIDLDVNVSLKPDIHIKGLGLNTSLTGDINVTKPVEVYQPRGEGQVTLTHGSYRAYGQDLEIENGRLLFAGPLDNPGINLRAYRPKLDVKAGVSISGDVRRPKISLFSEPVQSEADILSYLITGGPISGASGGEASLIAQAALSLGTQESSVLSNQIQSIFGLDDFSVGGGNTVKSTSVSASKRLSQKLTFKSSFNPFDQLWGVFLNYKLTDNWSVETESGSRQGADIVYSVESNSFSDLYERFWDFVKF